MQKLDRDEKKSEMIGTMVNVHEKEFIKKAAKKRGVTAGAYTRIAAMAWAENDLKGEAVN